MSITIVNASSTALTAGSASLLGSAASNASSAAADAVASAVTVSSDLEAGTKKSGFMGIMNTLGIGGVISDAFAGMQPVIDAFKSVGSFFEDIGDFSECQTSRHR